jgi:hypothetical protein
MRRIFNKLLLLGIGICFATVVATSVAAEPSAAELLRGARTHRAVWEHFPGFTADATVRIDGQSEQGTVTVDEHGAVSVKVSNPKLREWAGEQVGSAVDHRMPSEPVEEKPAFADEEIDHPLGRLIRLGDAKLESAYRIRDGVITEVNRREGPERFTISVTDIERNKEDKYLPRSFDVTVWDTGSGQIKSSSSYLNTWKRVGNFDLPQRILEIESSSGGERHVEEILLDHYSLSEKSK